MTGHPYETLQRAIAAGADIDPVAVLMGAGKARLRTECELVASLAQRGRDARTPSRPPAAAEPRR